MNNIACTIPLDFDYPVYRRWPENNALAATLGRDTLLFIQGPQYGEGLLDKRPKAYMSCRRYYVDWLPV